ncbi:DUF499 domain-containing protein [Candidatus Poriferisocius sp.]|uniref:DUF499 domain-containing protein n=1 Tax=Candidatus Poriferisocius sp. TaxID=3101276 RepID=UPI003B02A7A8
MTTKLTPWWNELRLRDELVAASGTIGDIQMSLRGVAYGSAGDHPVYRSVDYFGEITHPSPSLRRIAADIALRLGGRDGQAASAKPVWRFDQGMGGGKSHALVALWHLGTDPVGFAGTELGVQIITEAEKLAGSGTLDPGLGDPVVVALPGDWMDPSRPEPEMFGGARTLREKFLFRLYEGDHDRWVADKDTISYTDALRAAGRPVLILFDEVMHYVRASTSAGATEQAVKDQAFLVEMMRDTNEVAHCVAVMVMIDSAKDPIALSSFGAQCRDELEAESARGEVTTDAVTSPNDFASIIRRRLFKAAPKPETIAATTEAFTKTMQDDVWHKEVFSRLRGPFADDYAAQVDRSYPFHPALIHLAEQEWSHVAGFQRVRSTIRVFASTVYAHLRRLADAAGLSVEVAQENSGGLNDGAWAPLLIGPGDLVLSDPDVREALLDSGLVIDTTTVQNYRQVIATDIVDEDDASGNARAIDENAGSDPARAINPRAAERAATAALLYSLSDRPQGGQGGSVPEVLAASHIPDLSYGYGDAEIVLELLKDPQIGLGSLEQIPGKGGQPPRLYMSTKKTFGMFLRDSKNAVTDAQRADELRRRSDQLAVSGPFSIRLFVEQPDNDATPLETIAAASFDEARKNRLVILDPCVFSLLNGDDRDTRQAIEAAMGLGDSKLAVNWASSAVFAVVNTHRRRNALTAAGEYLAAARVASRDAVKKDPDLKAQADEELERASKAADKQVRAAYQHVVWLAETGDAGRAWADHRFEGDLETALNGSHVWKVLEAADKAFGIGEFTVKALLHNLDERDYGKPLSHLRDDFWRVPRLPLLPNGESDLRNAIWDAIRADDIEIVDNENNPREAYSASEINLSSDIQRLRLKTQDQQDKPTGDADNDRQQSEDDEEYRPDGEKRVTISATVAVDAGNRDAIRVMLDALRNSIQDGDLSWLQLSMSATMSPEAANDIEAKAQASGMNANITDQ